MRLKVAYATIYSTQITIAFGAFNVEASYHLHVNGGINHTRSETPH